MKFTVFTATYNRGNLLSQLYDSLCRQTCQDFEWIVVDDGSMDETEKIIKKMQDKENFFNIKYYKVTNGGKHRAWNLGVRMAEGELFFGCDSDDYLTDDALEYALKVEKTISMKDKNKYAGICGLKGDIEGQMIGSSFNGNNYQDYTYLEAISNRIKGDKSEIFYTEVWKKYPYYEIEGETFITEATSLIRMAEDGLKIRYFNHIEKIIEYLPGGLSDTAKERFYQNPIGWAIFISQRIKHKQLTGSYKWDVLTDYYYNSRYKMSYKDMAKYLEMNRITFFVGTTFERICYKLHIK